MQTKMPGQALSEDYDCLNKRLTFELSTDLLSQNFVRQILRAAPMLVQKECVGLETPSSFPVSARLWASAYKACNHRQCNALDIVCIK